MKKILFFPKNNKEIFNNWPLMYESNMGKRDLKISIFSEKRGPSAQVTNYYC